MRSATFCALFCQIITVYGNMQEKPPHIVMIIADDMGSNDVSYRGSNQFTTPNIDALGLNGVILNRHYTGPACTPSRAALLTGQYPIRLGMQGVPISAGEDRHLPVGVKTLPQLLKDLGYRTHLVGKWHLGSARRRDTPIGRGFDTHYGYWNGYSGYFDYEIPSRAVLTTGQVFEGFDLKENFTDAWKDRGTYATDLFTEKALEVIENQEKNTPMFLMVSHLAVHTGKDELVEVKDEKTMNNCFGYIENEERRRYADALHRMDSSVGRIVQKLEAVKMLKNTVIIFLSDNGAQIIGQFHNGGSNYPLRGEKFSLHEGGVKNTAIVYSPLLKKKNYVHKQLIHITDWMPTLYKLAGGDVSALTNTDGVDQWNSISQNENSNRDEILINIDEQESSSAIIGFGGDYKLLNGTFRSGFFDKFHPDPKDQGKQYNVTAILNSLVNRGIEKSDPQHKTLNAKTILDLRKLASSIRDNANCKNANKRTGVEICSSFCLFNLRDDPCETENLVRDESKKNIVEQLKSRLAKFWKETVPQTNQQVDINSNPAKYNGTWCTWLDDQCCVKT